MDMRSLEDWEKWSRLAREDPESFEQERKAAIEKLIMKQPAESRLRSRQLQWKIDAVRQTSPNSFASCLRLYDMLMDTVYGQDGLVETCRSLSETAQPVRTDSGSGARKAQILQFRKQGMSRPANSS